MKLKTKTVQRHHHRHWYHHLYLVMSGFLVEPLVDPPTIYILGCLGTVWSVHNLNIVQQSYVVALVLLQYEDIMHIVILDR